MAALQGYLRKRTENAGSVWAVGRGPNATVPPAGRHSLQPAGVDLEDLCVQGHGPEDPRLRRGVLLVLQRPVAVEDVFAVEGLQGS